MKKQILAGAVVAAFATSAFAAEVSIYGTVDTGLTYTHAKTIDADADEGSHSLNSFKMGSGISGPTRWGIKGAEELGNGYTVSFDLQSGFNSDDGTLGQGGRLFGREARLTVAGPFGELSFGRMGSLTSSAGTYDIFMGTADILDGGWSTDGHAIGGMNFFYDVVRCDNMLTYATPSLAGFKGYAQYSFKVDSTSKVGVEGRNSAKRYLGVGATYENGPFAGVMVYDMVLNGTADQYAPKDGRAFSLGASYDFGVAKVYAAYQYGKNQNYAGGVNAAYELDDDDDAEAGSSYYGTQVKGHNIHVGVSIPVCSGKLNLAGYYTTVKSVEDSSRTVKTFDVAATYVYPLSKRTSVYAGVGYAQIKDRLAYEEGANLAEKNKFLDLAVGLSHTF